MFAAQTAPLNPEIYSQRFYRDLARPAEGVSFQLQEGESDLWIHTDRPRRESARQALRGIRAILTAHINQHPDFLTALDPLPDCPRCPKPIREMLRAAQSAGVGPMAGVAGQVAKFVGQALLSEGASHVLVENGGDLFFYRPQHSTTIALFAGHSPLSMKIGVRIPATATPMGLATSSGTVGPSLSFGKADAVCVLSEEATLADAAATAIANRIKKPEDLEGALAWGAALAGLTGIVAIAQSTLAAWGAVELIKI